MKEFGLAAELEGTIFQTDDSAAGLKPTDSVTPKRKKLISNKLW